MAISVNNGVTSSGLTLNDDSMHVSSGGTAINTTVNENGELYISKGGVAFDTTVNQYGWLEVLSGGTATRGTVTDGGWFEVVSGGTAIQIQVEKGGVFYVSSGGTAFETVFVNGSGMTLNNGGVFVNTSIGMGGELGIQYGGTAKGACVAYNGTLYISEGGKLTGSMTFEAGTGGMGNATVTLFDGACLDFDISGRRPSDPQLVNNLSLVDGAPLYTLTVAGTEMSGTYKLAGGASGFSQTLTVKNLSGSTLGSLTVGGSLSTASADYTLSLTGSALNLDVASKLPPDTTPPTITTITQDKTGPTNQTVTVTATFADDTALASRQYKIDNGAWQDYSAAGVTVTENASISFKAVDTSDNETKITYNVTNIDKVKPTISDITANTTDPAQSVTVTATFADIVGLASKEYQIGSGAWKNYPAGGVSVSENTTVSFRAVDLAGNETTASYAVTNIVVPDTTKPTVSEAAASTSDPTNKDVTVTAVFADDVALASRQYKIGSGEWTDYPAGGVTVTENATVSFKAVDTSGNESGIVTYKVTNIDKVNPTISGIKTNTTALAESVTVKATFSDNVALASKQYKIGGGAWQDYSSGGVTVTENITVYFRAVDTAGNEETGSYTVTNIKGVVPDTTKPTVSGIKASTTDPTNQSVIVTAVFADDVALASRQYRIGSGAWQDYSSGGVIVTGNSTVYFKAVDTSGNESDAVSYAVTNIDKTPPAKPTASANTTASTSGKVTVTAVFSGDSAKKEFSLDGEEWQTYVSPIVFSRNGTVYFRGTDAAGNVSDVVAFPVTNIKAVQPDNKPDSDGDDYLYDKKKDWNDANVHVENAVFGNSELYLDKAGSVEMDGKHNMFGKDENNTDAGDVAKLNLPKSAKLSFTIDSTAAGTFYVYQDDFDKKGNRALITVGKVAVKAGKKTTLKNVCLTGDGKYYVAMISKKAGSEGFYNVNISDSTFFVDADSENNDNEEKGKKISVGRTTGEIVVDKSSMTGSAKFKNFVGYDDDTDYAKIDLASSAYLRFSLTGEGDGTAKFTIWKCDTTKNNGMSKVGGATTLNAKNKYTAVTKAQFLDLSGGRYEYYISMVCSDAAKGKGVYYNVAVADGAVFFDSADDGKNKVLYDKKAKAFYGEDDEHHFVSTNVGAGTKTVKLDSNAIGEAGYGNFVGYGDAADYAKIKLTTAGSLSFKLKATGDATFAVYKKGQDKKGRDTLVTIQTTKLKLAKGANVIDKFTDVLSDLAAGEYYISMTAKNTKANEKGLVYYNVTAMLEPPDADALAMPETSDALAMTDALSFDQFDADPLADAAAFDKLAAFDSASAWQTVANLA